MTRTLFGRGLEPFSQGAHLIGNISVTQPKAQGTHAISGLFVSVYLSQVRVGGVTLTQKLAGACSAVSVAMIFRRCTALSPTRLSMQIQ
jgi:hypothetical protein